MRQLGRSQIYTCGMRTTLSVAVFVLLGALAPSLAFAQRFPFERALEVTDRAEVDVSTVRGKIEIVAGEPGRIQITGAATVRVGWNVPANAVDLARQVAANPPIEHQGNIVRLRPPHDDATQRAVTVNFQLRVPADTRVKTTSDSGATSVRGIGGTVHVQTQSGAIEVHSLGGDATISSGSGAVTADSVAGPLAVVTSSSSFAATGLGSSLRVRTQSGEVNAALTGTGDVDIETGSSTIHVRGLQGALTAKTQSGHVSVQGAPRQPWVATTGSSGVSFDVEAGVPFSIDATSRSGSVAVAGGRVEGSEAKRHVVGDVNGGGPMVRINSGSGSIQVQLGGR